ncbi:Tn3 family transposase [Escherichia coli]|nr:Tn3 family transposase [Escherichia coli]EJB9917359.1 Tn3 family transposase [Escherichia coli]ELK7503632.1 Tn3 family transposase [Escherichia coli]ELP3839559.1 Tn3 family transposase [Escherichia coli]MBV5220460.1 Tn3 family transposase [Escherichia coli]MCH7453505.1 Tn3 family transposase [Escherichia coli]
MLVPRIRITSLLAEVHSWTSFLDCFTHYRTGEQAEDEAALMAAILADATKAGAERMAQSSRDNEMDAPDFTVSKYQTGSL